MQHFLNPKPRVAAANRARKTGLACALTLALGACASDVPSAAESQMPVTTTPPASDPAACKLADHCVDVNATFVSLKACCSPVTTCGYELPDLDPETQRFFPDAQDFVAMLAAGDPNGRCVPENFFFDLQPGLWKHRVEVETGQDIFITPDCQSFSLAAFILPGCCLPDNTCGLSTDESWPTLQVLAGGIDAPFTKPECVTAEELNQQFRDSGSLASLARTRAAGTCNYAALEAELPPW